VRGAPARRAAGGGKRLQRPIDPALIEQFVGRALEGVPQFFHDVGDNGDINNTNEPLAHASLLVQYLNRLCEQRLGGRRANGWTPSPPRE